MRRLGALLRRHRPACDALSPIEFLRVPTRTLILEALGKEPVKLDRLSGADDGIVALTLDRPDAKNAISRDMLKGIQSALQSLNRDSSANVMMVCSSVSRVFCAGADLKERKLMSPSEVKDFVNSLRSTFTFMEVLPIPTIAVIEGAALGGGLELALSCDLRICGIPSTSSFMYIKIITHLLGLIIKCYRLGEDSVLALPETGLAIIPGAGGTQRLPRITGKAFAKELIFTGRKVDGKEAMSLGLVNHCVPSGDAYQKALEIAREINQKGPLAIRMAKHAINKGFDLDMSSAMEVEEHSYNKLLNTDDRLEGLAAFAEKRKPKYKGT